MRWLGRWLGRLVLVGLAVVALMLAPVGYVEIACTGIPDYAEAPAPILPDPEWRRDESRTLTTYPEWHIVHAYDDYAQVIEDGDPHDFGYLRAISGFWTSLCPLKERAATMGGMTGESKMTIYTIGVSFTAEMLAKAAYEETLGRLATVIRGEDHAPLDDLSARQAAAYAAFLQQVPWYEWDFAGDAEELERAGGEAFRDRERRFALGTEYRAKAWYAGVIRQAVAGVGADEVRIRSVVTGLPREALAEIQGVTVVGEVAEGLLIETDRYRAFTRILERLAAAGADVVEIAGNDEILFTAISEAPAAEGALYSFARQGHGDWRHLILVPVSELAGRLRGLGDLRLEHVHDY